MAKKSQVDAPILQRCFIHPYLVFAAQSLIVSPQQIKTSISLLSQSLLTLCINKCHGRLQFFFEKKKQKKQSSINSKSYFAEVVNKNLNSWQSKMLKHFYVADF